MEVLLYKVGIVHVPVVETEIFAVTLGTPSSVDYRLICRAAMKGLTHLHRHTYNVSHSTVVLCI